MSTTHASHAKNRQFEIMVLFMEKNLTSSKLKCKTSNAKLRQKLWWELSNLLNADGTGPTNDPEKWKEIWLDWIDIVKFKALELKMGQNGTRGGLPVDQVLSKLEERLLNLIGWVAIEGNPNVEESGIQVTEMAPLLPPPPEYALPDSCTKFGISSLPNTPPSMLGTTFRSRKRKRRVETSVTILNKTEEEKILSLKRIAAAIETKAAAAERIATAEEGKQQALKDIAACLREFLNKTI